MHSFKSKYYPGKKMRWRIFQEQAMRHYAILAFVVMLFTLVRMVQNKEILVFTLVALALALFVANLMAVVSLRRQVAEIFFTQEHFAVLSVYDVLFKHEIKSFPLQYANPVRENNAISFHYFDRVLTLKSNDWDTFDLICTYLYYYPQT